jgi:hypothetical protein
MLESELQKMNPDMEAIEAYRQKDADYNSRMAELETVTAEREVVSLYVFTMSAYEVVSLHVFTMSAYELQGYVKSEVEVES